MSLQIRIRTNEPIRIIDKSERPWNMDGRSGISYTVLCHKKVDGDAHVEKVRVTEDVYRAVEEMSLCNFEGTIDIKNNRLVFDKLLSPDFGNSSAPVTADAGKKAK